MSYKNVEVIEVQHPNKKTWFQRHCPTFAAGAAVVSTAVVSNANAAGVDELFTQMATDVGGISTGAMTVISVLAGVLVLLLGWSYFKKVK